MKRRALIALPLALFATSAVLAQNQNDRQNERGERSDRRPPQRGDRNDPNGAYGRNGRDTNFDRGDHDGRRGRDDRDDRNDHDRRDQAWHREARRGRYYGARTPPRSARGAGPYRNYYPGSYLPNEYRLRHYVVNDWRGHGLNAPPRGYHWVQTGSDFVLVAIATGVILQLLLRD